MVKMFNEMKLQQILKEVKEEFIHASLKFGSFHSPHEGYAVLVEEVNELWEEVKRNQNISGRLRRIKKEAIQVSAMAIRIIHDCYNYSNEEDF